MEDLELEALQKRLQQKMLTGQLQDSPNPNADLGLNLAGGAIDLLSRNAQAGQDIASIATGIRGPNQAIPSAQSAVQQAIQARQTRTRQAALDDQNSVMAIQKLIDAKREKEEAAKARARANYLAGIQEGGDGSYSYVPGGAGELSLQAQRAAIKAKEAEAAALPEDRAQKRRLLEAQIAALGAKAADKAGPKEYKKEQYDAAGFAQRMRQAEDVFGKLGTKGFDRSKPGRAFEAKLFTGLQSEDSRSNDQAERNFVNAVLRRESGAAISPTEFENAAQQYFPRTGDTPEVIAQKRANRQQAMNAIQAAAGGAMDQVTYVNPLGGGGKSGLTPEEEQELAELEAKYGGR